MRSRALATLNDSIRITAKYSESVDEDRCALKT
jgi:hypothetical protein